MPNPFDEMIRELSSDSMASYIVRKEQLIKEKLAIEITSYMKRMDYKAKTMAEHAGIPLLELRKILSRTPGRPTLNAYIRLGKVIGFEFDCNWRKPE